jgi:hypothetical protein
MATSKKKIPKKKPRARSLDGQRLVNPRMPKTLAEKVQNLGQLFKELDETVGILVNKGQDENINHRIEVPRTEFLAFQDAIKREVSDLARKLMVMREAMPPSGTFPRMPPPIGDEEKWNRFARRFVERFQQLQGIPADSLAGVNTFAALERIRPHDNRVWQSADGLIRVADMDDGHIVNTLRMVMRRHGSKLMRAAVLGETGAIPEKKLVMIHDVMAEAKRRGLDWESPTSVDSPSRRYPLADSENAL